MDENEGAERDVRRPEPEVRAERKEPAGRAWLTAAIALGLFALGVYQGHRWSSPSSQSPIAFEDGRLVATGALENALYDPASGRRREEGPAAGAPFKGPSNETCRRFTDGPVTGTACQREGDWRVTELRQE